MENTEMKLVCERPINGVDTLVVVTTAPGNQGLWVKVIVPAGKPYWIWDNIPAGEVVACDFTGAPIVSDDVATNNANIAAITVEPGDVLTYAP